MYSYFEQFVRAFWLQVVLVLAALPGVTLLLRGSVWGSDSFAFWAVSCGRNQYAGMLSSPPVFVWFIENVIGCNLFILAVTSWLLYFLVLLSIYFFSKKWFKEKAYLVPIYVATLTPLFFIEVLRFENDFFGWSLSFIALGCFALACERNKFLLVFLGILLACFSYVLWQPCIFIIALAVFLLDLNIVWQYVLVIAILFTQLLPKVGYATSSLTQGIGVNSVSEEIPLVGLVFILHVLHFYKKIPFPLIFYGWFLLLLGAIKSKYMFLAVLPLIMGLLWKELNENGLSIPKLGIDRIPTLAFCGLLGIGWLVMGLSMYPTTTDLNEAQQAIDLAVTEQLPLYNDWGDGWMLVSLGYDTNYKISYPNPDWNKLERPYIAWSKEKIIGCVEVGSHTQKCV